MKRILLVICTAVLSIYSVAQDTIASKLDELIKAYVNMGRFNGSALIAMHGNVLLQKGYGMEIPHKEIRDFRFKLTTLSSVIKRDNKRVFND